MPSPTDLALLEDLGRRLPRSSPFIHVAPGFGLRLARARAEARERLFRAHVWGDSIWAQGFGASDRRNRSAPGLVTAYMQDRFGDGGSGFLSYEYATLTGTWTTATGERFAGCGARATTTATATWTGINGTTVRVFYRNSDMTGQGRFRVDGGAWQTLATGSVFGLEPGMGELTGLPDTPHTVEVEWVSGTWVLHGVQAYRSTGFVLDRLGQNGRAASHYNPITVAQFPSLTRTNGSVNITTPTPGMFRPDMVGKYITGSGIPLDATIATVTSVTAATLSQAATATGAITDAELHINRPSWVNAPVTTLNPFLAVGLDRPDVVIIALGVNDPVGFTHTPAVYADALGRIVAQYTAGTALDYVPDFVFVVPHFANWFDVWSRRVGIAAEAKAMAWGIGGASVDVWGMGRRNYKFWNDRGLFADTVHPNDTGHQAYAEPVISLLT